ncbi:hypothetical protein [Microbacterium sp. NPDC089695]|uniref:hypothetical protein n=1 Tax=Microbacterium sp. NPDC089695 TaxID=3364198 RepID=UPI00382B4324
MSTSDQNGQGPLTRKQLREIRLTGSTPVISPDEAAEAAAAAAATPPAPPVPRPAAPADVPPAPSDETTDDSRLTRRQIRERERAATASVPVVDETAPADAESADAESADAAPVDAAPVDDVRPAPAEAPAIVTSVPAFAPAAPVEEPAASDEPEVVEEPVVEEPVAAEPSAPLEVSQDEQAEETVDEEIVLAPVSASASVDSVGEVPIAPFAPVEHEVPADAEVSDDEDPVAAVAALGIEMEPEQEPAADEPDPDDVLSDVADSDDVDVTTGERPTVNSAFGQDLLADASPEPQKPFAPSFDELLTVGDSTGSHRAGNTLIFTPGPGEGSLSGPVASTGEILVTGSYELPKGLGSRGHSDGTTDGKEVDAVLIDGELPPASSPTPIAASSAISTIKPAGEVIRPPVPEKGNRLTLILAIVTGGLALAVGVVVVIALTTNVF